MKGAQRVAFTRTERGDEIVQPHGPVVVIEGQNGGTGTATADAGLNHGLNLEGAADQNKDLRYYRTPALRSARPI